MRTLAQIDAEITQLQAQAKSVVGTECEVYTRIVGYYRSLRNWNRGKKEEYQQRISFTVPEQAGMQTKEIAEYRYFFRKTCPNCLPVKDYITQLPLSGKQVDVDTEEGLSEAQAFQVLSTPTVIFFDHTGKPVHEAHSIRQLIDLQPWIA